MIKKFLTDEAVEPAVIEAADKRMDTFAREDGYFPAVGLKDALQNEKLEEAFLAAWNADSTSFVEVARGSALN